MVDRYCFHRLPFRISSAPEHFQRNVCIMTDLPGVVCMIYDIQIRHIFCVLLMWHSFAIVETRWLDCQFGQRYY